VELRTEGDGQGGFQDTQKQLGRVIKAEQNVDGRKNIIPDNPALGWGRTNPESNLSGIGLRQSKSHWGNWLWTRQKQKTISVKAHNPPPNGGNWGFTSAKFTQQNKKKRGATTTR